MRAGPLLDISIITVSWNVRELLRGCVESLLSDPAISWTAAENSTDGTYRGEIVVVDNASDDDTVAMLATDFPDVRVIANPDNRGFTRGNNQGLAVARGRYVFFLNPDTVVPEGTVPAMLAYLDGHPAVGAVGPQLRYGDGTPQSSRRRFPTLGMALFESTPLAWHLPPERNRRAQRYHLEDRPVGPNPQPVDWLVGAALLVRREALNQVGGFDEGYFMYSEELDWCRRAAAAGWQTVYLPSVQIVHYEGRSSEQAVAARHIRFQTSKVRYFRKFHGRVAAAVLRRSLLVMFAVEWWVELFKWLAGSQRSLRAGRMSAYREVLRNGLR